MGNMKKGFIGLVGALLLLVAVLLSLASCGDSAGKGSGKGARRGAAPAKSGVKTIVATYSILGSVVKDLVGDAFDVVVLIPDGIDPHEWEPSARDIETVGKASLVVENGLGLEEGMNNALAQARAAGTRFFTATDHITVRRVGTGQGLPTGDPDQATGAQDPHFWTDPASMRMVAGALADYIKANLGVDLSLRRADLDSRLSALDTEIAASVSTIPQARRRLVTGHESLGYFAQRYGFTLVGAVVPSLSSQAETAAGELVGLKRLIAANGVSVIFTELGGNPKVARVLADEAKVTAVPLTTHALPKNGGYADFVRGLASVITGALAR